MNNKMVLIETKIAELKDGTFRAHLQIKEIGRAWKSPVFATKDQAIKERDIILDDLEEHLKKHGFKSVTAVMN